MSLGLLLATGVLLVLVGLFTGTVALIVLGVLCLAAAATIEALAMRGGASRG